MPLSQARWGADSSLLTKCRPDEAFDVAARTRVSEREGRGTSPGGQQTKARTALEYFSSQPSSSRRDRAAPRKPRLHGERHASGDDQQGDIDRENQRGATRLVEVSQAPRRRAAPMRGSS